jgi:hypothetical protein
MECSVLAGQGTWVWIPLPVTVSCTWPITLASLLPRLPLRDRTGEIWTPLLQPHCLPWVALPPSPYLPLGKGNPNEEYFTNDSVTSVCVSLGKAGEGSQVYWMKLLPANVHNILHGSMYTSAFFKELNSHISALRVLFGSHTHPHPVLTLFWISNNFPLRTQTSAILHIG